MSQVLNYSDEIASQLKQFRVKSKEDAKQDCYVALLEYEASGKTLTLVAAKKIIMKTLGELQRGESAKEDLDEKLRRAAKSVQTYTLEEM
jgi:hypothetical protein